ncbi:YjbF family lipoprotein [uncultured Paracoccus sp.]|uniref:YjbF family lipoprotein n=1 Tax=uncultured Paracoccus sp. TaxID=189685 RepID=UPI0025FF51B8|nr:YjbF family lipoprotein [uncultured Paracoccus sp.]
MMGKFTRGACALAALSLLAACGNDRSQQSASPLGILGQVASQAIAERNAEPAAAPRSPSDIAAEALSVNPGPLILVGLESMGTTQAMAMTGQNGDMRTYMTPNEQALILRNGMLSGTRGLGNDLSVAEAAQSAALIRAGRSGQAQRTMRYYTGDGLERPLPMTCTIGPGPNAGVMVESCEGLGASFQNNYMVSGGQITVSRQWIGPALGYVTIQTLRP